MVSKRKPGAPSWQIVVEEIRSQNRATIEAVQSSRQMLEEKIDEVDRRSQARDSVLEAGIRGLRNDVQQNTAGIQVLDGRLGSLESAVQQNSAEIRSLESTVQQNSAEIRSLDVRLHENTLGVRELTLKVDGMARIEERVAALEKRTA